MWVQAPASGPAATDDDCEGDDDDLAADMTRLVNRLRALLHTLHPALERALAGGAITSQAACGPLAEYGGPHGLRRVGRDLATQWARANLRAVGRMDERLFDALGEQDAAPAWDGDDTDDIIRDLARRIRETGPRRARIERRMHEIASADEEYRLARTMPGMGGVRTTVALIVATHGMHRLPDAARLASYTGLAPSRRQSGTSIRHDAASRAGNGKLKRALYLAAGIAIIHDADSRAYHQRKRDEGKHHTQALISLARRRCDVLHSMIRHHTTYQPQHTRP